MKIYSLGCLLLILFSQTANALLAVEDIPTELALELNLPAQLVQLKNEAKSLSDALASYTGKDKWSDVSSTLNELGNVVQQANAIAYGAQNADAQFRQQFPGYTPNQHFNQQYQQNVATTMATLEGVLQALGISARDFLDEPTRIQALQRMAANAQGQTQAIQAAAQISTEIISQIQLLRQTVMAQTNAQTAYYAHRVQAEASNDAGIKSMFDNGTKQTMRYGDSGHYVEIPDY